MEMLLLMITFFNNTSVEKITAEFMLYRERIKIDMSNELIVGLMFTAITAAFLYYLGLKFYRNN